MTGRSSFLLNSEAPQRIKFGIDPTADSLHLGHLMLLRQLRQLQDEGHIAVLVLGDFTARIGDPTGKKKTRQPLDAETTRQNAEALIKQAQRILRPDRLEIHFNSDWLESFTLNEFMELAANLSVNTMLTRSDFKARLENGDRLGLNELLFPLMQGLDSVHLRADAELGGADQELNILAGRQLQKLAGQPQQEMLLMPLLPGLDGKEKMSKSLGNGITLDMPTAELKSRLAQTADSQIDLFLALLTDCDATLIRNSRLKQKLLAQSVAQQLGPTPTPTFTLEEAMTATQVLKASGLTGSLSAARRLIKNGGVKFNGHTLATDALMSPGTLKVGKHKSLRLM